MPNQIVVMNGWKLARINQAITALNLASRLRLYQSAISPTPADTLATYVPHECTFDTYLIESLAGTWGSAVKIIDGEYQSLASVVTYSSPASVGNTIFGMFIDDNAGNLLMAMEFDTPVVYSVGAPQLQLQVGYQDWAKAIVP